MKIGKKSKFSVRFYVGNNALRAASWHLRYQLSKNTGKDELYLFCRELNGALHVSMHPSGRWHVAFESKFFDQNVKKTIGDRNRFIQRWERPLEIRPGVTLALRIQTPASAIISKVADKDKKNAIIIPSAPNGKATEIRIIITSPNVKLQTKKMFEISQFQMTGGEKVYILSGVTDILNPLQGKYMKINPTFLKGKSRRSLIDGGLRIMIFGEAGDGSRIIWDCIMKYKSNE